MLEHKTKGIFSMIDDEGKKPKSSDLNLLANLHTAHRSKTKRWIKPSNAKHALGIAGSLIDQLSVYPFVHFVYLFQCQLP
jgi:hypothetical protein